MEHKKKILFIVNPISGVGKQQNIEQLIADNFDANKFAYTIEFTQSSGHATQIAFSNKEQYDIIVAIGGDGTVNEVAKGLVNGNAILGIVPVGSGNGLARYLNLPMKVVDAIKIINSENIKLLDTATINEDFFINVAGIGFDAHVAHMFANTKTRGALSYVKLATIEFQKYKSKEFLLEFNGQQVKQRAFAISFANSSQFGNNAYISPKAEINDGLIDVCIMSPFPKIEAAQLAVKMFSKRLDQSKYMHINRTSRLKVQSNEPIKGHIDGEPVWFPNEIELKVHHNSLKAIHGPEKSNLTTNIKQIISNK